MPAKTFALNAAPAFALPVLFLGYAIVANYEFATGLGRDMAEMPKSVSAYLSGEAATQIDSYYKKIMPHRVPSIDVMGAARYAIFREGRSGVVVGNDGWLFSREEFAAPLDRTADLASLSESHSATITLTRADEFKHPQAPRGRHPRDVRILPKSRDFH